MSYSIPYARAKNASQENQLFGIAPRILGNFLGYDASMKDVPEQRVEDWAGGRWADRLIVNWERDWLPHCKSCKERILESVKGTPDGFKTILLTHTLPHERLNLHPKPSVYNVYSGVKSFLEGHAGLFDYAVCGHTHLRSAVLDIDGCHCVNIGNDYDPPFRHFLLETY
jgi:hypothetical protein